ncbi:MAG: isoprenylcysteine carboxylmethyltransferase family protein [Anaerolineae bacterium]|nr:isoprenylcysteine carboxylmethyltransferase family protein [Anaerolineae bacterium]
MSESTARWHHGPSWLWLLSFVVCFVGDALIGRWTLLPYYVAAFYLGMVVIDLFTYPMLERWRAWVRQRGLIGWYLVEVGLMWIGTAVVLALLAPIWLRWTWSGLLALQVVGGVGVVLSVLIGVWAAGQMGWKRLLFVPALFPPGEMAERYDVPQRLVVSGPYRYVRNPLYVTDMTLIGSTALLTQNWFLVVTLVIYIAQLTMQLRLEERELRQRFGEPYERYLKAVPRFIPRLRPVDPKEIFGE